MMLKRLKSILIASLIVSSVGVCCLNFENFNMKNTLCMFTAKASATGNVRVVKAEDIIKFDVKKFSYKYNYNYYGEDNFIVITPQEQFKEDSTFYFELDGDIRNYTMHINPVKLSNERLNDNIMTINNEDCYLSSDEKYFISSNGDQYYIPIYWGVDMITVFNDLDIKGKITLKYLNEFIIDKKEVDIYIPKWCENIDFYNPKVRYAPHSNIYKWNEIKDKLEKRKNIDKKDYFMIADNKLINNPIYKYFDIETATLDEHQKTIIDIVANGYVDYVGKLKENKLTLENEKKQLESDKKELIDKNTMMEENIKNIQLENDGLNKKIDKLTEQINNVLKSQTQQPTTPTPSDTKPVENVPTESQPGGSITTQQAIQIKGK